MTKQEEKIIEKLKNRSQAEARIILRYIEKLQKENEEFQKANKILNDFIISIQSDYISKDKIRTKIKELEEIEERFDFIDNDSYARKRNIDFIFMLKGLLGE